MISRWKIRARPARVAICSAYIGSCARFQCFAARVARLVSRRRLRGAPLRAPRRATALRCCASCARCIRNGAAPIPLALPALSGPVTQRFPLTVGSDAPSGRCRPMRWRGRGSLARIDTTWVKLTMFLHHPDAAQLHQLLAGLALKRPMCLSPASRADAFARLSAAGSWTARRRRRDEGSDAVKSVAAGFAGSELSAGWPDARAGWRSMWFCVAVHPICCCPPWRVMPTRWRSRWAAVSFVVAPGWRVLIVEQHDFPRRTIPS